MAGHSKWAQIKRQKGVTDVKRGQLFSKIARTIILAARLGNDPETNLRLKTAIEHAKSVNLPKTNIERAVAKGSNKAESALEEFVYEAYGPEGSAFIIEGITDNKNRSTQEIKHLLSEFGGKFAKLGTVQWMFEKRGVIEIPLNQNSKPPDELELSAIDAGAESIERDNETLFIITPTPTLRLTKKALRSAGVTIGDARTPYFPKTTVAVGDSSRQTILKLIEKLEEHDDVQNVYTNISL